MNATVTAAPDVVGKLIANAIDPHDPRHEHRTDACYMVSFIDAVQGGCGTEKVPVAELHTWLNNRPGLLIRTLVPLWEHHHGSN
jgi:hypothetical protein